MPRKPAWAKWAAGLLLITTFSVSAASPTATHVVHVLVDGLSSYYFRNLLDTVPGNYPHLSRLIREGASTLNARCDFNFSETVPNHASMVTGRPVLRPAGWPVASYHGITYNSVSSGQTFHNSGNTNVPYHESVFDVAHDHGLSTAFVAGKSKLAICYNSYNAENGAPDLTGEDNGRNKVDYGQTWEWQYLYTCDDVMDDAINHLTAHSPNYFFIHMADLDYIGHYTGWGSERWNSTLAEIDACIGRLLAAIETNEDMAGQTAILLTADHGGGYYYNTHVFPEHPLNYTIPFMVWGPGWPAGANLYDLLANRFDPGTGRPDYLNRFQPVRNADAANLALTLLGLPPIPNSSIRPEIGPKPVLNSELLPGLLRVSWSRELASYTLESAPSLHPEAVWVPIFEGIGETGELKYYEVTVATGEPVRLFRLRKN